MKRHALDICFLVVGETASSIHGIQANETGYFTLLQNICCVSNFYHFILPIMIF